MLDLINMKKILAVVILYLFLNNNSFTADMSQWNSYLNAYYDGHSECRKEWTAIGNFSSNPKILLDIEKCALDKDAKALLEINGANMEMIKLIDKKHAEVFELAREASIDIITQGNVEANLKRFLKNRESVLNRYHAIQKALYFK